MTQPDRDRNDSKMITQMFRFPVSQRSAIAAKRLIINLLSMDRVVVKKRCKNAFVCIACLIEWTNWKFFFFSSTSVNWKSKINWLRKINRKKKTNFYCFAIMQRKVRNISEKDFCITPGMASSLHKGGTATNGKLSRGIINAQIELLTFTSLFIECEGTSGVLMKTNWSSKWVLDLGCHNLKSYDHSQNQASVVSVLRQKNRNFSLC